MDEIRKASMVLAALELTPAEPSDITAILRDATQSDALFDDAPRRDTLRALTVYLIENLDLGRVEHWHKRLDEGIGAGRYRPVIAGTDLYPRRLAQTWDAPPLLFAHGVLPDPAAPAVAIVGSRTATPAILDATVHLASVFAARGYVIVSGLAAGTDTAAHWGALNVGGRTVAVLGTGIEHVYPVANTELAHQISNTSGALLSQFAPDAPLTGTTFLRRNCVIAADSDVSVVMDGRSRSGSRHQIEQAIRYGRPTFLWGPSLRSESWARELAACGHSTFVDSADELVELVSK